MSPLPETKFSKLIDEINEIKEKINKPEDVEFYCFSIRRLKNEAETLRQEEPFQGLTLLGMLACIEGDGTSMDKFHKNAIRLNSQFITVFQYAISLFNMKRYNESFEYFEKLYKEEGNNRDTVLLHNLILSADILDFNDELQKYLSEFKGLTGEDHPIIGFPEDDPEVLKEMIDACEKRMSSNLGSVKKVDPELISFIENLVEGVELD